jgi:hypothetical protein
MPYALFEKDDKMSRAFATKEKVLKKADEAGLVDSVDGTLVLENDLSIRQCAAEPEQGTDEELDWAPGITSRTNSN